MYTIAYQRNILALALVFEEKKLILSRDPVCLNN
jgi:hypothetical protein